MKRIIFILTIWFLWQTLWAQTSTENYIATKTYTINDNATAITQIQYFDGLGRPVQTVLKGVSGETNADIVTLTQYDGVGRENKQWLPIVNVGNGAYVQPSVFTSNTTKTNYYNNDNYVYSELKYEASPLNRVTEQYGAGADWRAGNGKKVSSEYQTNTENEVALFVVESNGSLSRSNFYAANTLYKTVVSDEDNKQTIEYKDKLGRVLMKQSKDENIKHNTHYVYNDLNQLCYVISPKAADILEGLSGTATPVKNSTNQYSKALYNLCYRYIYDDRGNCIEKQLPGCEVIFMVYDKSDRLILSQDGNQRTTNKWTSIKYDKLGRVIFTGTITNSTLHSNLVSTYHDLLIVENYANGVYTNTFFPGATPLTINYYDDYAFIANYSSAVQTTLNYTVASGFDNAYPDDKTISTDLNAKGLLTGSLTYLLDGSGSYTIRSNFYDYRGLVVQTRSTNNMSGYDYDFFKYSFTGKVLNQRHVHKTSYLASPITENYTYTYDNAERLLTTKHKINTQNEKTLSSNTYDELGRLKTKTLNGGGETLQYTYNIRNWLKSITSPRFSETMYYQDALDGKPVSYNGNISAVKWGQGSVQDKKYYYTYDGLNRLKKAQYAPDELFNEEITQYDKNGNIINLKRNGYTHDFEMEWPVYAGQIDDIGFEYNGNQLKNEWENLGDQEYIVVGNNDFRDVYDENIDERYLYDANGNQYADFNKGIAWIKYNSLNLPQKIQFQNGNKAEYFYDASGVKYKAKWAYAVSPQNIPLGATGTENNSLTGITYTEYCGNYVYENGVLKKILTPEGYISTYALVFSMTKHNYFLKDHLGNTRRVLTSNVLSNSSTALSSGSPVIDYYPFGMEVTQVTDPNAEDWTPEYLAGAGIPYLYNGKEIDRMHGLNMYDYGARWRDGAIPGWRTVDPLCEKYYSISPYAYCANNPVLNVDPDGRDYWSTSDPAEIERLLNALKHGGTNKPLEFFNFTNWNHTSDKKITYNDETKTLYGSYVTSQNGSYDVVGFSIKAHSGDESAFSILTERGKWYERSSGAIKQVNVEFELLTAWRGLSNTAIKAVTNGGNVVYHSVENGITNYVGITNNFARRAAEHLAGKGIRIKPLLKGLTREDARAVEQALIEIHKLGKNGGTLLNKINSIAKTNPIYKKSLERGYELLKSVGY